VRPLWFRADEPARPAVAQVAGHGDVTHEAGAAAFGDRVKHAYPGDRRRVGRSVVLAEKLVAGAYRQDDGASLDRRAQRSAFSSRSLLAAALISRSWPPCSRIRSKPGEVGGLADVGHR